MSQAVLLRVIRAGCMDCCAKQRKEVRLCPSKRCVFWPYRMGLYPERKKRARRLLQVTTGL